MGSACRWRRDFARLYGEGLLLGEDRLRHTPKGESVRLTMGRAVDVVARRKRTDYRMQGLPKGTAEAAYEIRLNNSKGEKVTVEVRETMVGEWRILSKSLPHECDTGRRAKWHIEVPPKGKPSCNIASTRNSGKTLSGHQSRRFPETRQFCPGSSPLGRTLPNCTRALRPRNGNEINRYYQTVRVVQARRFPRLRHRSAHPLRFRSPGIPVIGSAVFCRQYAHLVSPDFGSPEADCD